MRKKKVEKNYLTGKFKELIKSVWMHWETQITLSWCFNLMPNGILFCLDHMKFTKITFTTCCYFSMLKILSVCLTLLVHSFSFFSFLVHSFSFYLPPLFFFTSCSFFLSFFPLTFTVSLPTFSFSLSLSIGFLCSFIQCFKIMIKYISQVPRRKDQNNCYKDIYRKDKGTRHCVSEKVTQAKKPCQDRQYYRHFFQFCQESQEI